MQFFSIDFVTSVNSKKQRLILSMCMAHNFSLQSGLAQMDGRTDTIPKWLNWHRCQIMTDRCWIRKIRTEKTQTAGIHIRRQNHFCTNPAPCPAFRHLVQHSLLSILSLPHLERAKPHSPPKQFVRVRLADFAGSQKIVVHHQTFVCGHNL